MATSSDRVAGAMKAQSSEATSAADREPAIRNSTSRAWPPSGFTDEVSTSRRHRGKCAVGEPDRLRMARSLRPGRGLDHSRPVPAAVRTYTGAVERRIFGLENEYGVTCTFRGQRRLSPDEVARYLFRRVVHWGRSSNVFLENGARLYLDVGSHPEYATPECDSIKELVAHDKPGERNLEALLGAAEMRLHEEGIAGDIYLFKNNTDSAGNSYGCHENYLVG